MTEERPFRFEYPELHISVNNEIQRRGYSDGTYEPWKLNSSKIFAVAWMKPSSEHVRIMIQLEHFTSEKLQYLPLQYGKFQPK